MPPAPHGILSPQSDGTDKPASLLTIASDSEDTRQRPSAPWPRNNTDTATSILPGQGALAGPQLPSEGRSLRVRPPSRPSAEAALHSRPLCLEFQIWTFPCPWPLDMGHPPRLVWQLALDVSLVPGCWCLMFCLFLELGVWSLVLPPPATLPPQPFLPSCSSSSSSSILFPPPLGSRSRLVHRTLFHFVLLCYPLFCHSDFGWWPRAKTLGPPSPPTLEPRCLVLGVFLELGAWYLELPPQAAVSSMAPSSPAAPPQAPPRSFPACGLPRPCAPGHCRPTCQKSQIQFAGFAPLDAGSSPPPPDAALPAAPAATPSPDAPDS